MYSKEGYNSIFTFGILPPLTLTWLLQVLLFFIAPNNKNRHASPRGFQTHNNNKHDDDDDDDDEGSEKNIYCTTDMDSLR